MIISAIVVFVTTYALILLALTWLDDQNGYMNGTYRYIDTMPNGLENVFVYLYQMSSAYPSGNLPTFVQIAPEDLPGGNWTEHTTEMKGYLGAVNTANQRTFTTYWYTDSNNRILFDIANLSKTSVKDGIQLIIGTRVTDPDVVLGFVERTFENRVDIYDSTGKNLERKFASVSVFEQNLTKACTNETTKSRKLEFKLIANPNAFDLNPDSNKYTIVDEMSDSLLFDENTVKVKLAGTSTEIQNWTLTPRDHSFEITVPDNLALEITYIAAVDALPNTPVAIENSAHFSGYAPNEPSTYTNPTYSYSTGGDIDFKDPPSVEITKKNLIDKSQVLYGATFNLERYTVDKDGNLKYDTYLATGSTDIDGKLSFGTASSVTLKTDTVYALREVSPPNQFIVNKEPYFFAVVNSRRTDIILLTRMKFIFGLTKMIQCIPA